MNDRETVKRLVEENESMAGWAFTRYMQRYPRMGDELRSAAYYGLLKAAMYFDPNKGFKFTTYAARAIFSEMSREIKNYLEADRVSQEGVRKIRDRDSYTEHARSVAQERGQDLYEDYLERLEEVAGITTHQKNVLRLKFERELSAPQIAEIVGESRSTVQREIDVALRSLKKADRFIRSLKL